MSFKTCRTYFQTILVTIEKDIYKKIYIICSTEEEKEVIIFKLWRILHFWVNKPICLSSYYSLFPFFILNVNLPLDFYQIIILLILDVLREFQM